MANPPSTLASTFANMATTHSRGPTTKPRADSRISFRRHRISAACSSTAERTTYVKYGSPSTPSSLYEVLGIEAGASHQEIKTAYRKLARVLHPDTNSAGDDSSHQFMKVHAAYETLSDPDKRADYDRSLLFLKIRVRSSPIKMSARTVSMTGASGDAVASRFSGYTRRRWETDQCW